MGIKINWKKFTEEKPQLNQIIILTHGHFVKLEENYFGAAPFRVGFIKYADAICHCESINHEIYWADPHELLRDINFPNDC